MPAEFSVVAHVRSESRRIHRRIVDECHRVAVYVKNVDLESALFGQSFVDRKCSRVTLEVYPECAMVGTVVDRLARLQRIFDVVHIREGSDLMPALVHPFELV